MRHLSVCSGIEAATVAWHHMGWTPVGFSEIEPFPSKVLQHHYPNVRNYGDLTKHHEWDLPEFDLLVGGTPCQAFSIAGMREGLNDPRGNLTLTFLGLAARTRPKWILWENVPGVLSDRTNAFGSLLGGLGELGYSCAWRVLDAKHFGVPQRRRRVFLVGHLGDWRRAAAVLFEPQGVLGDPAAGREAGEEVAGGSGGGIEGCGWPADVASTLNAHYGDKWGLEDQHALNGAALFVPATAHSLRADGFDAIEDGTGRGTPLVPAYPAAVAPALPARTRGGGGLGTDFDCDGGLVPAYAIQERAVSENLSNGPQGLGVKEEGYTLEARHHVQAVQTRSAVRRITPLEAERLQGFPDFYTAIPGAKDGPRYKALGNSMAVPCMRWIGERMERA